MSGRFVLPLAAFVAGLALSSMASAEGPRYGDRYHRGGYSGNSFAREYDSRRDNRREAIVKGAIRTDIAQSVAENRYRECMRSSGYDHDCDAQRYRDEQHARRAGRRAAIIVSSNNGY